MPARRIFLILTILAALGLGTVELNYYPLLSQGDHGRDLYAAQEILRGKLPYKDFWWVYGPLMPFYYAFFYKISGGTIISFLLGKLILKTACATFFYCAAATLMSPSVAFLAAMWFFQAQQDFFFTFNHIGGITAQLWVLFTLFSYIRTPHLRYAWMSLPGIFIYGLIKINFGLASLVVLGATIALVDWTSKIPFSAEKRKFALTALAGVPVAVGLIYWLLLKDLPLYAVRQCLPYLGDDQPHHFPPSATIPYYFTQHWLTLVHAAMDAARVFSQNWSSSMTGWIMMIAQALNIFRHFVLHAATVAVIGLWLRGRLPAAQKQRLSLVLCVLAIFFAANFHEFIVSGVWYRTFWSLPFLFMFHFLMMSTAIGFLPAVARRSIWTMLAALMILSFTVGIFTTQEQKVPPRFINSPHAQIFVGNEPLWTSTVNAVTAYLNQNLKKDELFFALPYDDIYYYLTNRESPTRQLIFFDHIKIPPQQEMEVIRDLESKNVNTVLLSNRMKASETGLGTFGKTYCPLISQYLAQNFTPVGRQGGNWEEEPGWGNNHGVLILKRK